MSSKEVNVNPQEVRFTQDSISRNFRNSGSKRYQSLSLRRTLQDMEMGLIKASGFPMIEIYKDENGITWSNDNRRLWVFRKAGLTSVPALLSSTPLSRAPPLPEKREAMSRADYFPVVRGG